MRLVDSLKQIFDARESVECTYSLLSLSTFYGQLNYPIRVEGQILLAKLSDLSMISKGSTFRINSAELRLSSVVMNSHIIGVDNV